MKTELIFGIYPVLEALKNNVEFESIYLKRNLSGENINEISQLARKLEIPLHIVPIEKLNRLTQKTHQGVVAFTSQVTYMPLDEIITSEFEAGNTPLLLLLDGITDVRNFGAIARSAECAGVSAIVFQFKNSAPVSGDAIKASAGALNSIPLCRVPNLKNSVVYLKNSGLEVVAVSEKGNISYKNYDFNKPCAIIMGSEEKGINPEVLKVCSEHISIPMVGTIQSLNVSVASGIVLFEALSKRMSEN